MWARIHEIALFVLGAGLLILDVAVISPGEVNDNLLLFYAALMGLGPVLNWDRKKRGGDGS